MERDIEYELHKIQEERESYYFTDEDYEELERLGREERNYSEEKEKYKYSSEFYKTSDYIDSVKENKKPYVRTGFKELDRVLNGGLREGLYFIGAISSLGKTTFCLQIASQLSGMGEDVLFISLEQSAMELREKNISRNMFKGAGANKHLAKSVTAISDIDRINKFSLFEMDLFEKSIEDTKKECQNLFIIEGVANYGYSELERDVLKHMSYRDKKPIVFIDYIQIMKPISDRLSDKQNIDKTVSLLKKLSRDYGLTIFGISSFNRENYNSPVTMTAFKESGAIEYSSDVLLGLQPRGLEFGNTKAVVENNKDIIDGCKRAMDRDVELVILKNRKGRVGSVIDMTFYAPYNCYEEGVSRAGVDYIFK